MREILHALASIMRFKWYTGKSTFLAVSYRAKATGLFGGVFPYKLKVNHIVQGAIASIVTFPIDFTASLQNCILICPIMGCVTWS